MEIPVFILIVIVVLLLMKRRSTVRSSGGDDYVHGAEATMPVDDVATRRAGTWPGPGGPVKGSGGGNVQGGG